MPCTPGARYYSTLAKLLFMEDTPQRFRAFAAPLQQTLAGVAAAAASLPSGAPPAALRSVVPDATVVGLFRDLRGVAAATNSRRTYCLLFDWLYPAHFPAMLRCLEAWADTPGVAVPLLKFVNEFVWNRSQRLQFDSSSPNGILLFREVGPVRNCALPHRATCRLHQHARCGKGCCFDGTTPCMTMKLLVRAPTIPACVV